MDVTTEIRCRLKEISNLLNEIEEILCRNHYDCEEPKNTASCICVCVQNPADADTQTDCCEDKTSSRTFKTKQKSRNITTYPEERDVKCEDLSREKSLTDFDDTGLCFSRKNVKLSCDKLTSLVVRDMLRNMSNKKTNKKSQKDRERVEFKNNLNDVRQKFLSLFDEANKEEPNAHCN
jgi:hypothetical protein